MEVFADKRKIQQVLYNLLDNAIKFSDPESTVTIEQLSGGEGLHLRQRLRHRHPPQRSWQDLGTVL